jgi:hypothetical protein
VFVDVRTVCSPHVPLVLTNTYAPPANPWAGAPTTRVEPESEIELRSDRSPNASVDAGVSLAVCAQTPALRSKTYTAQPSEVYPETARVSPSSSTLDPNLVTVAESVGVITASWAHTRGSTAMGYRAESSSISIETRPSSTINRESMDRPSASVALSRP